MKVVDSNCACYLCEWLNFFRTPKEEHHHCLNHHWMVEAAPCLGRSFVALTMASSRTWSPWKLEPRRLGKSLGHRRCLGDWEDQYIHYHYSKIVPGGATITASSWRFHGSRSTHTHQTRLPCLTVSRLQQGLKFHYLILRWYTQNNTYKHWCFRLDWCNVGFSHLLMLCHNAGLSVLVYRSPFVAANLKICLYQMILSGKA